MREASIRLIKLRTDRPLFMITVTLAYLAAVKLAHSLGGQAYVFALYPVFIAVLFLNGIEVKDEIKSFLEMVKEHNKKKR